MGPEGASFKAVRKPLPDHLPGKSALKKKISLKETWDGWALTSTKQLKTKPHTISYPLSHSAT